MPLKKGEIAIEKEPEAQFDAGSQAQLIRIETALISMGAHHTKTQHDEAIYYDTKHFCLAREGIEARGKDKDDYWRFDLKTPLDTNDRIAMPDADGVVDRIEIKTPQVECQPSLSVFKRVPSLQIVAARVRGFFDKDLEPKFIANFAKSKFELEYVYHGQRATIEYALQTGFIQSMDGSRKSRQLFIAEVEHRSGDAQAYRAAVRAFSEQFADQGARLMSERKWHIGLRLVSDLFGDTASRELDEVFTRIVGYHAPKRAAA